MTQNTEAAERSAHVTRGPVEDAALAPWAARAIKSGTARLDLAEENERLQAELATARDLTWFWQIVDRDGLTGLPSDERAALATLVTRAARATVVEEIAAERRRQIEAEGWTPEHDNQHNRGELALAAACYARHGLNGAHRLAVPLSWPWNDGWWKPKDRRRDLIRAAALIVAEIERLDRLAAARTEEARNG
jgi:hypothetical protein